MSGKNDREQDLRIRLTDAARREFLESGYEKASLRKICAGAGVTTGALYFTFQNKEDLFECVVRGTVSRLEKLSQEMIAAELEDGAAGIENEKRLLEFFWKNREDILILLEKAKGTRYENFMDDMTSHLEDVYEVFFRKYSHTEADRELIHILVKMKRQAYIELITGGYTLERTVEMAEKIGWYADGGFECLMKQLNKNM